MAVSLLKAKCLFRKSLFIVLHLILTDIPFKTTYFFLVFTEVSGPIKGRDAEEILEDEMNEILDSGIEEEK